MIYNRKYATATATGTHICVPLLKAGSDDFAQTGDWTPATGDVKVSIDGGAFANVGTLPTFITGGLWQFVFTIAELAGKSIRVLIQDAAAKAVQDDGFVIETFGHASAMYPDDQSVASTATPPNFSDLKISATTGLVEVDTTSINAIVTAFFAGGSIDGLTFGQAMNLVMACLSGDATGLESGTITFKGLDGTTSRLTVAYNSTTGARTVTRNAA